MNTSPETLEEIKDRYGRCDAEVIEWAAAVGTENLKARFASRAAMTSEAATTLTVLLAGIGGSLAYAVKVFELDFSRVPVGAAVLCVYLCVAAALLVWKCMMTRSVPAEFNEPDNLMIPAAKKISILAGSIKGLNARILEVAALNCQKAFWLNVVRLMAIGSPAVFVAGAVWLPNVLRRFVL